MSHYLTARACEHSEPDICDYSPNAEDDGCWGADEYDFQIDCDEPATAICRWRCTVCESWWIDRFAGGQAICRCDQPMIPTACSVIDWFTATGENLGDVLNWSDPRIGRHEVDADWDDDGYQLIYSHEPAEATP